jgi:hypothetical protein
MTKVHFVVSGTGVINMFTADQDRLPPVNSDHPNYPTICKLLSKDNGEVVLEELLDLMDVAKAIEGCSDDRVRVEGNTVYVEDMQVPQGLAQKILQMMSDGYGLGPFIAFCQNLMENPSMSSVEQLFTFMDNVGLPITEDGHFLAYKGVTNDYKDKWTNTIDNSIGEVVKMRRNQVMDDPKTACGKGLHAGALEYANGWAGSDGKLVLVKVNPRDAVSVPECSGYQKLRCCEYQVVADHEGRTLLKGSVVTTQGVTSDPSRFQPQERPVNTNPASGYFEQEEEQCCPECDCYPCDCEFDECDICGYPESDCRCCPDCYQYPCECCDECGNPPGDCGCCEDCECYPCQCDIEDEDDDV